MEATKEPSERRRKSKSEPESAPADLGAVETEAAVVQLSMHVDTHAETASEVEPLAAKPEPATMPLEASAISDETAEASDDAQSTEHSPDLDISAAPPDRKRIEEQLEALKRRESELRRALAIADHPELAEAIRVLEGRAYAVTRVEAKMAQGLSKAEERRRETLEKKLASLHEKRAELDAQIAEIEAQLLPLGEERTRAFEVERREALEHLIAALSHHHDALHAAGLDAGSLVPDIARWMPEVITLAEHLASKVTPKI